MTSRRLLLLFAGLTLALPAATSAAAPSALSAANASFAKIEDYSTVVVVHETDGRRVEDRTYHVLFKKPEMERVDVVAGPGRGGGVVWLGGEKVKGHHGGLLSGLRLTLDLHNSQVTSLRGDSVDTATIPAMLNDFKLVKGEVSETTGPVINGAESVAVNLAVADPAADNGVSREVLYLSETTHMPVRRERFGGSTLLKLENVTDMQTNTGLTATDFPW